MGQHAYVRFCPSYQPTLTLWKQITNDLIEVPWDDAVTVYDRASQLVWDHLTPIQRRHLALHGRVYEMGPNRIVVMLTSNRTHTQMLAPGAVRPNYQKTWMQWCVNARRCMPPDD